MKFWLSISHTDTEHLLPLSQRAEALGFEGVLLADHIFVPERIESKYLYDPEGAPPFAPTVHHPDVWASMAAIGTVTTTLRISIATYILPLHDVFATARGAATAAVHAGGRVEFSVGAGWMKEEFDVRGIGWKSRGRRMDEIIEVLRLLWSGEPTEYHGEFHDFPRLTMRPAPPGPIPILVAGSTPMALRRTARLGDGWIGHGNTPAEARDILTELGRLRDEAGRSDLPFECIVPLVTEPKAEDYTSLGALGMTASVAYPPSLVIGEKWPSLEQEIEYIEGFAERVIRPFADA